MKKTVCLNMIVKNESPVILRCLESVKRIINYWVIVDTGSQDGTQQIIRNFLKDVPGELHEKPWVDFAHNRNEALSLSKNKGDYLLMIDADEELQSDSSFCLPDLTKDFYAVIVDVDGLRIQREILIKNSLNWAWIGVVHESLVGPNDAKHELLEKMMIIARQDGNRSKDPDKFINDAKILEKALKEDPENRRNQFYLAFSYDVAGKYASALKNYQKRALQEGSDAEVFYSLYRSGFLQEQLEMSYDTVVDSYSRAYLTRPTRAEPLFYLARYFIKKEQPFLGYLVSKMSLQIPLPKDAVLVEYPLYAYRNLKLYADCCYLMKKYDEAKAAYRKLLNKNDLPDEDRSKIKQCLSTLPD